MNDFRGVLGIPTVPHIISLTFKPFPNNYVLTNIILATSAFFTGSEGQLRFSVISFVLTKNIFGIIVFASDPLLSICVFNPLRLLEEF
jgi:hypothetical protein